MTINKEKTTLLSNRVLSLDVLRGITIAAMILVNNPGSWNHVFSQLRHADWHGCTLTDLVFPFFLFIVGVSIVFALTKRMTLAPHEARNNNKKHAAPAVDKNTSNTWTLYKKILLRTAIIFLLGLFLNGFPFFDLSTLRIPGVLQRIAICYLFAAIIFLHASKNKLNSRLGIQTIIGSWAVGFLLVYWALMEWFPVPGIGPGLYEKGANFAAYIDNLLLKGHLWSYSKTWDPEGIISTLPAISTTLFGACAGLLLKSKRSEIKKTVWLLITGTAGMLTGLAWNSLLPINKSLWTGSYAIFTAGLASICLGICYYLIDVKKIRRWILPFRVFGMNAIALYVLSAIVAKLTSLIRITGTEGVKISLKTWLYNTFFSSWPGGKMSSLAYAFFFILIMYACMWLLYRKKIFIKI